MKRSGYYQTRLNVARSAGQLVPYVGDSIRRRWKKPAPAKKTGLRRRRAGVRTMKKKLHQRQIFSGSSGSFSKFFYGKRSLPRSYRDIRALAKNYKVYNGSLRLTGNAGVQTVQAAGFSMFSKSEVQDISTAISVNKTNKFLLQSCSAELMLTNQDQGNVRITLYDIIARRDLNNALVQEPANAWANSYSDEGGNNTNYTVVGTTPFSSDLFTQFFVVKKITHIVLGEGQTHNHRIHYSVNRIMDDEYVQNITYGARGLTCWTMVVAHGEPYNDTVNKSSVSTGQVAIDIVHRRQYKYTWKQDNDTSYSVINNLSTFANAESVMDVGSGVAVTDAPA